MFSCSDSDFWTVHDSIIKKQTSKYSAPSSNSGESTQVLVLLITVREICFKSVNLADAWFAALVPLLIQYAPSSTLSSVVKEMPGLLTAKAWRADVGKDQNLVLFLFQIPVLNSFLGIHVSLRAFHGDLDKVKYLYYFLFFANCKLQCACFWCDT